MTPAPRCYFCGKFVPPTKLTPEGVPASQLGPQATCFECDDIDADIAEERLAESRSSEYHPFEGTGTACDVCDNDLANEVHQAFEDGTP